LPAKSSPNAQPPGVAPTAPPAESQDSETTAAGPSRAEDLSTSGADAFTSPAERRAAERTARRRERAEAHEAPPRREHRSPRARVLTPESTSILRDSLPPPLIAVIAGGVSGLILGALSIGGWVIGLLVAGLTVILLRALGSGSQSTRAGNR
jgi:hypothetical protein